PWGQQMFDVLLVMDQTANQWRQRGATTLPQAVRDDLLAQYFEILAKGFAVHSPQVPPEGRPKKLGRHKQDASKNLLDALLERAEDILAFLDDLTVPLTNNLAER